MVSYVYQLVALPRAVALYAMAADLALVCSKVITTYRHIHNIYEPK